MKKEIVIAYHSHAFSREERNYCVTWRELLSVVIALKHFESYLLFRNFAVRADQSSLRWLQTLRHPEQQLCRWLAVLQAFYFEIYHRAGKLHQNCDSLSRRPCEENCKHCSRREQVGNDKIEDKDCLDVVHAYRVWRERGDLLVGLTKIFHENLWDDEAISQAQRHDPDIGPVWEAKLADRRPDPREISDCSRATKQLIKQ